MEPEKSKKKSHTGRNVTVTALLLAALLGGGRYGLGLGRGGGSGLLPESGNSIKPETAQTVQAEEPAEAQEAEASEAPAEETADADDGVLSIVVKEAMLYYEGEEIDLAGLEQALLRDYVQGATTVKLTDDHAIKSAYDEAAALLERLGIPTE